MKKVLGIIGSKRFSGNCEVMAKEISRQIPEPHQLTLLRLPQFHLSYCTGCYRCLIKDQGCVLKDDLTTVLEAVTAADALVLVAPTYFMGGHSCLKVFIERGLSFYSRADSLWGKPAVGVGIAGIEGKEGSTLLDIERFFTSILAENKQSKIVYGALPGEVIFNEKNRQIAGELGRSLFEQERPREGHRCQFCGGETFRFLDGKRLRCMLCSNEGTWSVENDLLVLRIEGGEHELWGGKEQALKHRTWLLGMVGRFEESKDQLKEVAAKYDDGTLWIRPEGTKKNNP